MKMINHQCVEVAPYWNVNLFIHKFNNFHVSRSSSILECKYKTEQIGKWKQKVEVAPYWNVNLNALDTPVNIPFGRSSSILECK